MDEIKGLCQRATEYLESAQLLINFKDFNSAVSRSYYAMFYMTQACLLSQNISVSTHKGNATKFFEIFVKTGIFPTTFSRDLSNAMDKRSRGDYEIFTLIDLDLAQNQLDTARNFCATLKNYLLENEFLNN